MNSQREAFEQWLLQYNTEEAYLLKHKSEYNADKDSYYNKKHPDLVDEVLASQYHSFKKGWQAATEQGVGEAFGRFDGWAGGADGRYQLSVFMDSDVTLLERGAKLYTHPPKPTGGGMPKISKEAIMAAQRVRMAKDNYSIHISEKEVNAMAKAILATQQPPEQE